MSSFEQDVTTAYDNELKRAERAMDPPHEDGGPCRLCDNFRELFGAPSGALPFLEGYGACIEFTGDGVEVVDGEDWHAWDECWFRR